MEKYVYILFDGLARNTANILRIADDKKCEQRVKCWTVLRAKPSNKGFIIRLVFFTFFAVAGIFLRRREKRGESQ